MDFGSNCATFDSSESGRTIRPFSVTDTFFRTRVPTILITCPPVPILFTGNIPWIVAVPSVPTRAAPITRCADVTTRSAVEPGLYDFTPATTRIHEPPASAIAFDSVASATVLARSVDFRIEASPIEDGKVVPHSAAVGAPPTLELITPAKSAALRLADSRSAASTDT